MKKQVKQFEVLNWASLFLEKNNCEPKVAEILLQHYLQVTTSEFYMMMQEPIPKRIIDQIRIDILKHVKTGIPVQHLTGYEFFYGRKFFVNEHVLIPRPETEELVQHVIELVKQDHQSSINIADIGTGSGMIAITLALELPHVNIYGTDLSKKALNIAKQNAQYHHVDIPFFQGDFLQPMIDQNIKVDYIVSNPPYIKKSDKISLSRTVKNFEPDLALFAEDSGLAAYKKIIQMIPEVSKRQSKVIFEIGYDQGKAVYQLIKHKFPHSDVNVIQDINGKDRIVSADINL